MSTHPAGEMRFRDDLTAGARLRLLAGKSVSSINVDDTYETSMSYRTCIGAPDTLDEDLWY